MEYDTSRNMILSYVHKYDSDIYRNVGYFCTNMILTKMFIIVQLYDIVKMIFFLLFCLQYIVDEIDRNACYLVNIVMLTMV